MPSRYILTQSRQNGDDLAVLKTRVDRIEEKVDRLEQIVGDIGTSLSSLKWDLPGIVADAVRDVLRGTKIL
jgi:tetrahydromethanopterin S-methyltransferase subunit B